MSRMSSNKKIADLGDKSFSKGYDLQDIDYGDHGENTKSSGGGIKLDRFDSVIQEVDENIHAREVLRNQGNHSFFHQIELNDLSQQVLTEKTLQVQIDQTDTNHLQTPKQKIRRGITLLKQTTQLKS